MRSTRNIITHIEGGTCERKGKRSKIKKRKETIMMIKNMRKRTAGLSAIYFYIMQYRERATSVNLRFALMSSEKENFAITIEKICRGY